MAAVSWIEYAYLAHVAQPKPARQLYRLIKRLKVCRIVEVGIADLDRSVSLVRVARRYAANNTVAYTGLDWFDARSNELSPLSLKEAYSSLHRTGASVRLLPGEPARALAAAANAHQHTGLLLIAPAVSDASLAASWFFMPRMLDERSVVLRTRQRDDGEPSFTRLSADHIAQRVGRLAA